MTYPVDDNGNVRVDFVWGNFPLQPNEGRENNFNSTPYTTDGNWTVKGTVGNANLAASWSTITFNTGDGDGSREQTYVPGYNDIATTGYSNFPSFIENYAGDGDADLEVRMPDLAKLPYSEWGAAIAATGLIWDGNVTTYEGATLANDGTFASQDPVAGALVNSNYRVVTFRYEAPTVPSVVDFDSVSAAQTYLGDFGLVLGTVTTSTDGATSQNNNWVKSQSPAAGTKVAAGTAVNLVKYVYEVPSINYNIAGIRPHVDGNTRRTLYLNGRNSGITVGSMIQLSNTGVANYDRPFDVLTVENDDAFNTGGQKLTITNGLMTADGGDVTNTGTWAVYP